MAAFLILSNQCYQDIWKPVSVRPVQRGWPCSGFIRTDGLDSYGIWNLKHPHWDEGYIRSYDKKELFFMFKSKNNYYLNSTYMRICYRSIFLNHSKLKTSTQMLLRDLQMVFLTLRSLFFKNFFVFSLLQFYDRSVKKCDNRNSPLSKIFIKGSVREKWKGV